MRFPQTEPPTGQMLIKSVVCLAVLATVMAGKIPSNASFGSSNSRIIGGQNAEAGQYPYQVSLRYKYTNQHFCGGSIVSDRWILTAAHCTYNQVAEFITAVVDTIYLNSGGIAFPIITIVFYPGYEITPVLVHDISMLKTGVSIVFTDTVKPISIGTADSIGDGVTVIASGWGQTTVYYMSEIHDFVL